jgi:hypothetical protein
MERKVHYYVYKSPSAVRILSQFNPVLALPSWLFKVHVIMFYHLQLGLFNNLFPSYTPNQ